jgi:hypothetical protein
MIKQRETALQTTDLTVTGISPDFEENRALWSSFDCAMEFRLVITWFSGNSDSC